MLEVNKDVPVPQDGRMNTIYPFKTMEVGDSFVVPKEKESSVRSTANYHKNQKGVEFTVRRIENNQVRVWRTK